MGGSTRSRRFAFVYATAAGRAANEDGFIPLWRGLLNAEPAEDALNAELQHAPEGGPARRGRPASPPLHDGEVRGIDSLRLRTNRIYLRTVSPAPAS
jgi:hypothetical protein